ncbi:structural maintenance of chromosomes protein 4-like [Chelonus insularis]|uniref:structural maintenance of chromosomes protein 4-like n=1 Tax=Chelonus insularis TaxID=460826 RepID=UPI00158A9711|nr:structural maintenance of chromosomes protein 4-like [Chelonus insularis]
MATDNQPQESDLDERMDVDDAENADDSDEEGGFRIDEDIYIPPPPVKFSQANKEVPRLIISQIVNMNFKSYAGQVVIGPFHECFSAIVGPNGSGKSNVIDSMLFVFGYRASKIRSKKISVLIHNSNEHPNINSCEVAVYFRKIIDKEDGGYEDVPDSEFIISRTAFKDNSSYYELNKKKVQFKEIAKILKSEGIDLKHNRFLILQGEIEQIAMMKPKAQNEHDVGMLEFLEDIIGTDRYKEPLERLFTKMEILTEKVAERTNRLKVVEKERESLKEPMEEAADYLKLENIIIELRNKLYHCQKYEVTQTLKEKEEKQAELEADINKLKEELTQIRQEKDEINQNLKEKCKKWDSIQQKQDAAQAKFDALKKRDEALYAELVATNKRRKENQAAVKTEESNLEDLKKVPQKSAEGIEECEQLVEKQLVAQKKEEEKLQTIMNGLREKTEPLLKERAEFETKLIDFRKNIDEAKAAFDIAESELQIYTSVEKTEKEKLEVLQKTLKETIDTFKDRKEKLVSFETKIPATEKSLAQAKKKLNELNNKEIELNNKLRQKRVTFEDQKSAMHANKSRNAILDALMQEKSSGRIPGIFGRLGDLGAIDAKYDVAVSTACKPLDNIVVDTVNTAQACIQFLRDHNIGRATFIPLEKQERFIPNCRQKITTPENVPRLFDLIKVNDERILPAFYYGLQNTLVANDVDQATRIAYGPTRFRVVTLEGELIELSGTMSGGGKSVAHGRMGQKVKRNELSPQDLENLQTELDQIYEMCNQIRRDQQPLKEQIETLTVGLNEMVVNKKKFAIEVQTLEKQGPLLKAQLKAQEKKVAESICDLKKTEELEKNVEVAKKKLEKVQERSQSTEDEVKRINHKIDEISGNRVKEQQKIISNIVKAIEKAKSEICRLQVAVKTAERNSQKTEQKIQDLKANIKTCEERLKDMQRERTEIENEAREVQFEIDSYAEALNERNEAGGSLKGKLEELQTRETKIKALKIDLDLKFSDSKKMLSELSRKIDEYIKRISSLKLNQILNEQVPELPEFSEEEIEGMDGRTIEANLKAAKERLPEKAPDVRIIKEYLEKNAIYMERAAQLQEVTDERKKIRSSYDMVKRRRMEEFFVGFSEITSKLKEMYQMITLGGAAELELVDSLDFTEGIVYSVRPPKKSWKQISYLSGGEKTLSSLALVFALHHYKPTPLYFMDEIDAALDFKNVSIVGTYIKERTQNAQFTVISLRSEMFELADTLVGIYKTHNATKSVTVNMKTVFITNPAIEKFETDRKKRMVTTKKSQSSQSQYSNEAPVLQPISLSCPNTRVSLSENRLPTKENDQQVINENDQSVINNSRNSNESNHSSSPKKADSSLTTPVAKRRRLQT